MSVPVVSANDTTDLQSVLHAVDAGALLVWPRILRRILREHFQVSGLGLRLPHRRGYPIDRDALFRLADPAELDLAPDQAHTLPPAVLLLEQPSSELLELPRPQLLRIYWHRLFHLHIDRAMNQAIATGKLSDAVVRRRIDELGRGEFDEIRSVLTQEKILLPPRDDCHVYAEFVAVYLGLRTFAIGQIAFFFPLLTDRAKVDALVAQDVDAAALLSSTRLPGAANPDEAERLAAAQTLPAPATAPLSEPNRQQLLDQARQAEECGNVVRAALLQARTTPNGATEATTPLEKLSRRLQAALWLSDAEAAAWREALPPLLERAAHGFWRLERRLLYDLQKACIEHERTVATVDLTEWALSLGRRPIRRELPGLRGVRIVKHLRSAAKRLTGAVLPEAAHKELTHLIHQALERAEGQLRTHFRPLLHNALDAVGLVPRNLPERCAREKVVEVLLDRIGERGFFTMGELRDALSANQLKVDETFPLGDQLLLLNQHLAVTLDGVYRPAEFYLRWLQTFSFGFFGTPFGRFLTKFLLLPFGGAFVILAGIYFLGEEGQVLLRKVGAVPAEENHHQEHGMPWDVVGVVPFATGVVGLGVFLLLVMHVTAFRVAVGRGLARLWRGLRLVLIDAPAWLLRLPLLHALLHSRPVVLFCRYLVQPLAVTAVVVLPGLVLDANEQSLLILAGCVFVSAVVFFQTRLARDVEETLIDWLARSWRYLSADLVPSVIWFIMWLSAQVLDYIERLLYTVDEWLLFRTGESKLSLALKGVLGVFWFAIAYVIRIYTNLLVEPTVNPIKHFPVVTVGHKLMLPMLVTVFLFLQRPLEPLIGKLLADGFAGVTLFFVPGIFGFIAWELKSNWRLFEANRPTTLRPVLVGSHGETIPRLLRPGFHSGTVPKLFRKLRRAARHVQVVAVHKRAEAMHHVEKEIRHFIDREFLNLLLQSRRWGGQVLALAAVHLGCQRIRLEFDSPELGPALAIAFDEEGGWLVGGVVQSGWLDRLTEEQRAALATALAGLYRLADVDFTREQLTASLPPEKWVYRLMGYRLLVRSRDGGPEAVYDLSAETTLTPRAVDGRVVADLPELEVSRLGLAQVPVTWGNWVRVWEADQAGEPTPPLTAVEVRLLPAG